MSKPNNSSAAEDLIESLMKEVGANGASEEGFSLSDSEPAEGQAIEGMPELDSNEAISLDPTESRSDQLPNVDLSSLAKNAGGALKPISASASQDVVMPDEKTRLGHMPKMNSAIDELDLNSLPDADALAKPSLGLDLPDPDKMDANILDIPDPDNAQSAGGLLDIPDPDVKTSIRSVSDLENKVADNAESLFSSSEGVTQALPTEVPRRPESTKTINLAQIPDNPPHFGGGESNIESLEVLMPDTSAAGSSDSEKTIAVSAFANRNGNQSKSEDVKVSIGRVRSGTKAGQVYTSSDATLLQAENLRIVQQRVLELENEIDHLRQENEELASAAEIIKTRADELNSQMQALVTQKTESEQSLQSEIMILKGNLQHRDQELQKSRIKTDELESRLKMDLKKIRVRERELENRLELSRAEKNAIVRSKDENILELKRKMDHMQNEIDSYRQKCLELNKLLDSNHESFKKTTRALRLALANLELSEEAKSQLKKVD